MRRIALKLAASFLAVPLSVLLVCLTRNEWFFILSATSLPLIILYWMDFGQEIRNSKHRHVLVRAVGILMGVPQALFGLVCFISGIAIVLWVLYNTLIERQPHYSGGLLTFGIGPALTFFGAGWVVSAFRRDGGEHEA